VIGLKINGKETFFGEDLNTSEEFIEDICNRINMVYDTVMEEDDKMRQLAYLIGFLTAFKGRLNRVCERL